MTEREVAETIQQQIKYPDMRKYWCWGSRAFKLLPSGKIDDNYTLGGLSFKVSGMKMKGHVEVRLMGDDTYTVRFYNTTSHMVKESTMVYFDELQELIDETIEKVSAYAF